MDGKDMRALIHMKHLKKIVTDKKYFDNYLNKLEKILKFKSKTKSF